MSDGFIPIFDDCPETVLGVETGLRLASIQRRELVQDVPIHTRNAAQIEYICLEFDAVYKIERIDSTWSSLTVLGYTQ